MSDLGLFELDELPSDAYEDILEVLAFPKQRKLAIIREALTGLEETGTVVVEDERYGVTILSGELHSSDSSGSEHLVIAGVPVAKNKSTSKKVKEWDPLTNIKKVADFLPRSCGELVPISSLKHGDFVSVDFESPVYGVFTVVGVCTEGDKDSLLLVNKWIIREGTEREGLLCGEVRMIREKDSHDVHAPPYRVPLIGKASEEVVL